MKRRRDWPWSSVWDPDTHKFASWIPIRIRNADSKAGEKNSTITYESSLVPYPVLLQ
jgi:hypothetical protein